MATVSSSRTTRACGRVVIALAVTIVAVGSGWCAAAFARTEPVSRHDRLKAEEVCEEMVSDAVVAVAGQPLTGPPEMTWDGRQFRCVMRLASGELRIAVDVGGSRSDARTEFRQQQRRADVRTLLYGIGDAAFTDRNGTHVARTDNFVLRVDPTRLVGLDDLDLIGWSATRAVFDCW